ncbi:MAG: GNAT family N-acetyltransferase [Clostridiaceae bacterium]|nr:GNAT family N-acetyltransferase [Clostridiaceae bacterium]
MDIILQEIKKTDNNTLFHLFQLFSYDISEFNGKDVESDGCYHGYDVSEYTTNSSYISYFIKENDKIAGFAVVRIEDDLTYLRHFFILRKFRKMGIGIKAAFMIFDMCKNKFRVSTMDFNKPAIEFWRKVCNRYTGGCYNEIRRDDDKGPQFEFNTGPKKWL